MSAGVDRRDGPATAQWMVTKGQIRLSFPDRKNGFYSATNSESF